MTATPIVRTVLHTVALVGNPNAGKTSLFNALTGSQQKVANYPGVTVERAVGRLRGNTPGAAIEVVDVPGLYSTNAVSVDEQVAAEEIRGAAGPALDLLVFVADVTNLERSLYFFSQVADLGQPMIVALTMTDALAKQGGSVNIEALSQALGTVVVSVISHKGVGLEDLKSAILTALEQKPVPPPVGKEPGSKVEISTDERYKWAQEVRETSVLEGPPHRSTTEKIDAILTHRVFGLAIFVGVMYGLFQSIYTLAAPMMDGIEWLIGQLGDAVSPSIEGIPWLQSLVVDGLIGGVGSALVFLPQILILFFFIAALEGTGYLARSAFLMDRLLGWCGLSGRAFIPLLSSFACAIPGIMAARVMPDARSRLATIIIAPLMSCSARLPVYILLIGAFIEPRFGPGWAGFTLFAMHFVGLIIAIPIVLILNRNVLKMKRLPFIMELPRYQWPKWRDVWLSMFLRGKVFLQTAGTIIVLMSVVMWALLYFPRDIEGEARAKREYSAKNADFRERVSEDKYLQQVHVEQSYLGRIGKGIEPVFAPAGFDWRLSTAILCAFPAREVVVSSIGILFSLGSDAEEKDLQSALSSSTWPDGRPLFTPWTAVGFMVFFALCCQCMSTLATVRRETNSWKWPLFMFVYMTGLAYVAAVAIHRVSLLFG
ncbi:MAG: ferrous iron transporter B [Armatimonadetes bacterium]|nr:ferrous iron transporter B [Armatimonadota bacterium]